MGKDSLIKSTSKKKSATKKEAEEKRAKKVKKTAPKSAAKVTKKTKTPKATATAKRKTAAQKMVATKRKTTPKAKKATAAPKRKPVTIRELLAKKFDVWKPDTLFRVQDTSKQDLQSSAPPAISTSDPEEAARLKALLFKKFDYEMLIKAAAEKAAAEKAAAEAQASISYQPPMEATPSDPAGKMMKYGIAGFVLLLLLVIGSSFMNTQNFYIKPTEGATEIWQGKFAPKGDKLLISLPGMLYTNPVKARYSKDEVFPLIFTYYIEKADALLDVPGLPDFEGVKSYLNKALEYGTTAELRVTADSRLNNIDLLVLQYKADVAASKDTIHDLEASLAYLKEASQFEMDALQKRRIDEKIAAASTRLQTLEAQAASEKAAAEKKEVENPDSTEKAQ